MHDERLRLLQLRLALLDVAATTAAFLLAYWIRASPLPGDFSGIYPFERYLWIYLVAAAGLPIILKLLRHYEVGEFLGKGSFWRDTRRILLGVFLSYVLLSVVGFSLKLGYVSRLLTLLFVTLNFLLLMLVRAWLLPILRSKAAAEPRSVIIVGSGPEALRMAATLTEEQRVGIRLLGLVAEESGGPERMGGHPVLGDTTSLEVLLSSHVIDEVFFATSAKSLIELQPLLLLCEQQGITARLACDFVPRGSARLYLEHLDGEPLLTFTTIPHNVNLLALKRITDVVLSLLLLVLAMPLFVVVPVLIKLTSEGPVFYKQIRCGLNGRRFTFLKFRSMVFGADERKKEIEHLNEAKGPVFKISSDPRLTPIGRFLRKTSIDELPQLINVLRGEMSLVGPRPPLPEEVERYQRWQRRRLSMKPGLTCLWQVSGRSELDFDEWVALDIQYIDNWSPWLDLGILVRTVPAVLSGRGAH